MKGSDTMADSADYKNKWQVENCEWINMVVLKGYKEKIKTVAPKTGESINSFRASLPLANLPAVCVLLSGFCS